ncbi:hypothetical protein V6N13_045647 [Hibiscus sabdariffa]|uniref:Secreted protein n=1 Tax=Hibiscus sabdariffa TaxID=183260 RepID=A0ABR2RLP3_9ROSI
MALILSGQRCVAAASCFWFSKTVRGGWDYTEAEKEKEKETDGCSFNHDLSSKAISYPSCANVGAMRGFLVASNHEADEWCPKASEGRVGWTQ